MLLIYPLLVSPEVGAYHNYSQKVRPFAKTIEYLYLRIQTLYYRFKASIHLHTHLWNDAQIARHMILHLNNKTFQGYSQVQLNSIQKTCQILIQRGSRFQVGLQQINNQMDHYIADKAIRIQSMYRRHQAQIQSQKRKLESLAIRKKVEKTLHLIKIRKEKEEAVVKIQALCRKYQAQLKFKQQRKAAVLLQSHVRVCLAQAEIKKKRIAAISIIEAKDSYMPIKDIRDAIETLTHKELKDDEGIYSPKDYVREEYFHGNSMEKGVIPESILLAKIDTEILGFIIMAKLKEREESFFKTPISTTCCVAYLAVHSSAKRYGIGTKLMLAAMSKTKNLGKRYLTLEYIFKDGCDRAYTKKGFYNSFSTRYSIPMRERGNTMISRKLHVHPYFDLKNVAIPIV